MPERSLKDIGKECGISSVSVLNRIKRLKEAWCNNRCNTFRIVRLLSTFELSLQLEWRLDSNANVHKSLRFFSEHTYLVEPSTSIGKYDFYAVIYAEDITKLNERVDLVKRLRGIKRVVVSVWSGIPCLNFDNINLAAKRESNVNKIDYLILSELERDAALSFVDIAKKVGATPCTVKRRL